MVPGRKFSTRTSADRVRRRSASMPASDFKSSVTLRLLRLTLMK